MFSSCNKSPEAIPQFSNCDFAKNMLAGFSKNSFTMGSGSFSTMTYDVGPPHVISWFRNPTNYSDKML